MDLQIKNTFDKITKSKIWKSFLLTFWGLFAAFLIQIIKSLTTIDFGNEFINSVIALAIPFIINAINEYRAGIPKNINQ